jgi:hypothetical protein
MHESLVSFVFPNDTGILSAVTPTELPIASILKNRMIENFAIHDDPIRFREP